MTAPTILPSLQAREEIPALEARAWLDAILQNQFDSTTLKAELLAWRDKGETEDELAALAGLLRERVVSLSAPAGTLDTCGTGGDGSHTFNISTATALVAAGMGIPVAKHGNRSASSKTGSADVLKELGVNVDAPPKVVERSLNEAGIAFLFAPLFHTGLRHAAPVRKELGVRTIFNLLGPLANPARASCQVLGVYEPRLCVMFARVMQKLGSTRTLVVCGEPEPGKGFLDEFPITGQAVLSRLDKGTVAEELFELEYAPELCAQLGLHDQLSPDELRKSMSVENAADSAKIILSVLQGKSSPALGITLLNAAAAAWAAGKAKNLLEGVELAQASVRSRKAQAALEKLVQYSNLD